MMFSFFNCCKKNTENKNKPPVHVLMPAFNAEKFILSSIQSIIEQTYHNTSVFILDDGSTDNSMEKIHQFLKANPIAQSKIHIKSAGNNRGICQTRKELYNWSREKNSYAYILWLDSDDKYTDNYFIEKVITKMLGTKADICLYNFSVQFEDENQKNNASVLLNDKQKIYSILGKISSSPMGSIHPLQLPNLLDFTSLGWTKCYAPTIRLPEPANCPYEDFVFMAALLEANTITALSPEEEPLQYLRRSSSICGQRTHENFSDHIPLQLQKFFNTVLDDTYLKPDQKQKVQMAQQFVLTKIIQYEGLLKQLVETQSYAGISQQTLEIFLKKSEEISQKMEDEITQLTQPKQNLIKKYA